MSACESAIVNDRIIVYDGFRHRIRRLGMATKSKDWQALVKGILKAELKRRNLTYGDLAEKLREIGVKEDSRNISNKIARGSFTAVFFVQCLEAIGVRTIHLEDS